MANTDGIAHNGKAKDPEIVEKVKDKTQEGEICLKTDIDIIRRMFLNMENKVGSKLEDSRKEIISILEQKIDNLKAETIMKINSLKEELQKEIAQVRMDLNNYKENNNTEMARLEEAMKDKGSSEDLQSENSQNNKGTADGKNRKGNSNNDEDIQFAVREMKWM